MAVKSYTFLHTWLTKAILLDRAIFGLVLGSSRDSPPPPCLDHAQHTATLATHAGVGLISEDLRGARVHLKDVELGEPAGTVPMGNWWMASILKTIGCPPFSGNLNHT